MTPFIVIQMQENFRAKAKKALFWFGDFEKAFDTVLRDVIRWAMRMLEVEEWLVTAVMSTYTGPKTVVRWYQQIFGPNRTWRDVVQKDGQVCKLNREDAMDRSRWRKMIKDD